MLFGLTRCPDLLHSDLVDPNHMFLGGLVSVLKIIVKS